MGTKYQVDGDDLTAIANKIRTKGGTSASLEFPDGFKDAVDAIQTGITPTGTKNINTNGTHDVTNYASANVAVPASAVDSGTKNITSNGNNQDVVGYAAVNVSVPNSYAAGDEGKVVSNGALVAQTSDTVTQNGTVDTTLISSLNVNVSGGGGEDLVKMMNGTLTSVDNSDVTTLRDYAFQGMTSLTSVSFPNVTQVGKSCFSNATNLASASFPSLTTIGGNGNQFEKIKAATLAFPSLTSIVGSYTFQANTHLTAIDLGSVGSIGQQFFTGDTALTTIVLRKSTAITTLVGTNAFNNTPFKSGGTGGTIYIPKALYDHLGDNSSLDYKKATNWTTVNGYGTITWAKIEGSYYETHYADGTPIS